MNSPVIRQQERNPGYEEEHVNHIEVVLRRRVGGSVRGQRLAAHRSDRVDAGVPAPQGLVHLHVLVTTSPFKTSRYPRPPLCSSLFLFVYVMTSVNAGIVIHFHCQICQVTPKLSFHCVFGRKARFHSKPICNAIFEQL